MSAGVAKRVAPLLLALGLAGCGAVTTVDDNQGRVCPELEQLQDPMMASLAILNQDETLEVGRAHLQVLLGEIQRVRPELSDGQKQLLDRYDRVVHEYDQALATRAPDSTFKDNLAGLDSYKQNVLATYRTMLTTIDCPLPSFYEVLPST